MMLTAKARYAVTAMVDMAVHNAGAPIPLSDIAVRQGITIAYLEQIFVGLRKAGLVRSVRGPGGGYLLQYAPEEITIACVITAIGEPVQMTHCGNKAFNRCGQKAKRCLTHDLWEGLEQVIASYFASISLHDVSSQNVPPMPALWQAGNPHEASL